MGKKLYRVYLTLFDRKEFERVVEGLKRRFSKVEARESRLVPEFKFIEVFEERDGFEDVIRETIISSLGRNDVTIRVDRISI